MDNTKSPRPMTIRQTLNGVAHGLNQVSSEMSGCTRATVVVPKRSDEIVFEPDCDEDALSPSQECAKAVLMNIGFQGAMNLVICFHIGLSIWETDQRARGDDPEEWQGNCEKVFMGLYCLDIALRIFTLRWEFFYETMNCFDLFIVTLDVFFAFLQQFTDSTQDIGPISLCRALRAVRIIRVIRNFAMFRDLYLMMKGMAGALRAIIFATILIFGVLTCFSILAVEQIDPVNKEMADKGFFDGCDRCRRAFSSVMGSNLTFLTAIIAGDSWGQLAVPLIEEQPWTGIVIISAFITVELGLLNVIVAVVVDRQAQAREEDKALQFTMKEEQAKVAHKELVSLFKTMDDDGSGTLTLEELESSFDEYVEFREMLRVVDISREDLPTVFASMDMDMGGVVDYEEFTRELHHLRTLDMRTLMYLTRQHVIETKQAVLALGKELEKGGFVANAPICRDVELRSTRKADVKNSRRVEETEGDVQAEETTNCENGHSYCEANSFFTEGSASAASNGGGGCAKRDADSLGFDSGTGWEGAKLGARSGSTGGSAGTGNGSSTAASCGMSGTGCSSSSGARVAGTDGSGGSKGGGEGGFGQPITSRATAFGATNLGGALAVMKAASPAPAWPDKLVAPDEVFREKPKDQLDLQFQRLHRYVSETALFCQRVIEARVPGHAFSPSSKGVDAELSACLEESVAPLLDAESAAPGFDLLGHPPPDHCGDSNATLDGRHVKLNGYGEDCVGRGPLGDARHTEDFSVGPEAKRSSSTGGPPPERVDAPVFAGTPNGGDNGIGCCKPQSCPDLRPADAASRPGVGCGAYGPRSEL